MRRSKHQMLRDALVGLERSGTKTSFYFGGQFSGKSYLSFFGVALRNELVRKENNHYRVTEKGRQFMRLVKEIENMVLWEEKENVNESYVKG